MFDLGIAFIIGCNSIANAMRPQTSVVSYDTNIIEKLHCHLDGLEGYLAEKGCDIFDANERLSYLFQVLKSYKSRIFDRDIDQIISKMKRIKLRILEIDQESIESSDMESRLT